MSHYLTCKKKYNFIKKQNTAKQYPANHSSFTLATFQFQDLSSSHVHSPTGIINTTNERALAARFLLLNSLFTTFSFSS